MAKNRKTGRSAGDKNIIITCGFSNELTKQEYTAKIDKYGFIENQCGGCSFFAPLNADWGVCCHTKSRQFLETVFEHFGCEKHVNEGWDAHSFSEEPIQR